MEQIRIGIYEDNQDDRIRLMQMLTDSGEDVVLVAGESGEELLRSFYPGKFDLLFLDIFMGEITGIEALSKIREQDPSVDVCLTTTSPDFTREGYRMKAIRYLEKPVQESDILEILQDVIRKKESMPHLGLKQTDGIMRVPFDMIVCIEQHGRGLKVYLSSGEMAAGIGSLDKIEEECPPGEFCRCHKSYLVNLFYVNRIDRELSTFELQGGVTAYISRRKFWTAKHEFEDFLFSRAKSSEEGYPQ